MLPSSSGPVSPLRPLGLGEILDRAVSLSIRAFVLLALIYLVIAVPRAVIQYFAFAQYGGMLSALVNGIQRHTDTETIFQELQGYQQPPIVVALGVLIGFILTPFSIAALTIACATVYFGGTLTFRDAYRLALDRWLPLFLVNVMWSVVAVSAVIGIYIVIFVAALGAGVLYTVSNVAGIVLGIVFGLVILAALLGIGLLCMLAWQLSVTTCILEHASFIDAFVSGARRVLSGLGIRRALLAGLVFGLIYGGLAFAESLGTSLLVVLVHAQIVGTLYATLFGVVAQVIATAFMVIFYFDVRVREDGLDLELAAVARAPQGVRPA